MKKGFQRVKIDGEFYEIAEAPPLDKKFKHDIDVVVDRLVVRPDIATRLADSLETALRARRRHRRGRARRRARRRAERPNDGRADESAERLIFSEKFACPVSGFTIPEIEPRLFSFNNPFGACPACDGLGVEQHIDADLVIPDKDATLRKGAIAPWAKSTLALLRADAGGARQALQVHARHQVEGPAEEDAGRASCYGSGEDDDPLHLRRRRCAPTRPRSRSRASSPISSGAGARPRATGRARRWRSYFTDIPCAACNGYRLKPEALCVKIDGQHIGEVSEMSVKAAGDWFTELPGRLNPKQNEIAVRVLKEIRDRLKFLVDVGLEYLTLARASGTLSGGESQRIRLASQIGSGLTGVLYVLDEPSIGLHQRDNARLLETLKRLRDLGNTVIVVEHDEDAIRTADHVLDIGPGAGIHGGQVDRRRARPTTSSPTPDSPHRQVSLRRADRPDAGARGRAKPRRALKVVNAARQQSQEHHRRDPARPVHLRHRRLRRRQVDLADRHALQGGRAQAQRRAREPRRRTTASRGSSSSTRSSTSTSRRSGARRARNPATYTGAFTPIREWFAELPEAKARGYEPGRFSFNVKGGRCEACQGDGVIKIEMHFLPDVYVTCDVCKGKRYNRETLEIKFKGKSIADVLDMTVEEAAEFFKAVPSVRDKLLDALHRVGLGYIHVGQQATTLSGGEAQRVKLSKELSKRATGRTLYILDEPTTGLHFHDVAKLLEVLHELVDQGNTVVVIEHNLEVIKTADWIIDLGPEGGDGGGEIVAAGTPEDIAKAKRSYTGQFLAPVLGRREAKGKARTEAAE